MGFECFYNDKVTLFNQSIDGETGRETWYPTFLDKVNLVKTESTSVSSSDGMKDADNAKLFVMDGMTVIPKRYVPPKEWQNLPDAEKKEAFTITSGCDFFIEGEYPEETTTEQSLFETLRETRTNVFRVTNVARFDDIMAHFEIGGQ